MGSSDRGQCAGQDFQSEILLVPQAVRPSLENADLVVQPLDIPQRGLVLRAAVGRDSVSVSLDQRRKLLVGRQALPLERVSPVVEEPSGLGFFPVAPQLLERFLE